jgi:hypothetical protein
MGLVLARCRRWQTTGQLGQDQGSRVPVVDEHAACDEPTVQPNNVKATGHVAKLRRDLDV